MKILTSRLLFVDEDGEFLQQMRDSLPGGDYIETVHSVRHAMQKLKMGEFDLVGIDLDGLKTETNLFQWIRRNQPLTVCIIFTTLSAAAAATAAEQVNAFDYFVKPVDPLDLNFSVSRALMHRRLLVAERDVRLNLEKLNKHVSERIRRATSELLKSNERLNSANRAKDQFLAAMSHELRTPLTAITGAVRILQSTAAVSAGAKEQSIMEILDRNVCTLKRLLDDLLDCSRIATGKLEVEVAPINLLDSVMAAVETMKAKAADANVHLQASLPSSPVIVNGNALRLQQVIWNLIDNAIKFTPQAGNISITVRCTRNFADITVRDSGIGLSDGDKDRIFEPFAQAHGSEDQRKGGLGLGLALVRELTELHNGKVRVESDGPGCGSQFVVTLPLSKEQPFQRAA